MLEHISESDARLNSVKEDICNSINTYSIDSDLNVPDYIIADYLIACLISYRDSLNEIDNYRNK